MGLYLGKKKVALVFKKEVAGIEGGGVVNTEDIVVNPTTTEQVVKRSTGKYINQVTVGAIQTEEKTVTENGEVTPTQGKFLTKVTVDVEAPEPVLQEKTATENGEVVPDDGYDGLSKVTVNVPTSSGIDRLQWKCDNMGALSSEFYKYSGTSLNAVLDGLDTSKVKDFGSIFRFANALAEAPYLRSDIVTNMFGMFGTDLTGANYKDLKQIDVSGLSGTADVSSFATYRTGLERVIFSKDLYPTKLANAFQQCWSLVSVENLNFEKVTDLSYAFEDCKAIVLPEIISLPKATKLDYFLRNSDNAMASLTLDIPLATSIQTAFYTVLIKTIRLLNSRKVTNWNNAFYGVKSETIEADMYGATNTSQCFVSCKNLTNLTLKNIRTSIQIGSGTSYGHLLTEDSLLNTIKELWNMTDSTSKTLTVGTANKTKLASIYVKLVDINDEMRAEDEYIDNKLPFVKCESTDEGAMLVEEYASTLKNWTIG